MVENIMLDLIISLTLHLSNDKIRPSDIHLLRKLSNRIHTVLGDDSESEDCENEKEAFSLKAACRELTHELQDHRGELTSSERKHLLELIEAAAKVMQFY
jgi:hypothetical protein